MCDKQKYCAGLFTWEERSCAVTSYFATWGRQWFSTCVELKNKLTKKNNNQKQNTFFSATKFFCFHKVVTVWLVKVRQCRLAAKYVIKKTNFYFFFETFRNQGTSESFFPLCLSFSAENGLAVVAHPLATKKGIWKTTLRNNKSSNWKFWPTLEVSDYRSFMTVFFQCPVCIDKALLSRVLLLSGWDRSPVWSNGVTIALLLQINMINSEIKYNTSLKKNKQTKNISFRDLIEKCFSTNATKTTSPLTTESMTAMVTASPAMFCVGRDDANVEANALVRPYACKTSVNYCHVLQNKTLV